MGLGVSLFGAFTSFRAEVLLAHLLIYGDLFGDRLRADVDAFEGNSLLDDNELFLTEDDLALIVTDRSV